MISFILWCLCYMIVGYLLYLTLEAISEYIDFKEHVETSKSKSLENLRGTYRRTSSPSIETPAVWGMVFLWPLLLVVLLVAGVSEWLSDSAVDSVRTIIQEKVYNDVIVNKENQDTDSDKK